MHFSFILKRRTQLVVGSQPGGSLWHAEDPQVLHVGFTSLDPKGQTSWQRKSQAASEGDVLQM
jgi:hypothetical protein